MFAGKSRAYPIEAPSGAPLYGRLLANYECKKVYQVRMFMVIIYDFS
jgi:hypothetical protein